MHPSDGKGVCNVGRAREESVKDESKMRWRKEERWFNRTAPSNRIEEKS